MDDISQIQVCTTHDTHNKQTKASVPSPSQWTTAALLSHQETKKRVHSWETAHQKEKCNSA